MTLSLLRVPDLRIMFAQVAGCLFTEKQGGSNNLAGEWLLVGLNTDEEDAGWAEL